MRIFQRQESDSVSEQREAQEEKDSEVHEEERSTDCRCRGDDRYARAQRGILLLLSVVGG